MDPLSIATGCAGLITTIGGLSLSINAFVRNCREARSDLDRVSRELHSLQTVLELIQEDAKDDTKPFPETIQHHVSGIVKNCSSVVVEVQTCITKYGDGRVRSKASWVLNGQGDMEKLRSSLEAHKSALELVLDMLTLSLTKEIKTDTTEIRNDTAAIKDDTAQILQEIAQLQARLPDTTAAPNDYILQKFLEDMATYTETTLDVDGGFSDRASSRALSFSDEREESLPGSTQFDIPIQSLKTSGAFTDNEQPRSGSTTDNDPLDKETGPPRQPITTNFDDTTERESLPSGHEAPQISHQGLNVHDLMSSIALRRPYPETKENLYNQSGRFSLNPSEPELEVHNVAPRPLSQQTIASLPTQTEPEDYNSPVKIPGLKKNLSSPSMVAATQEVRENARRKVLKPDVRRYDAMPAPRATTLVTPAITETNESSFPNPPLDKPEEKPPSARLKELTPEQLYELQYSITTFIGNYVLKLPVRESLSSRFSRTDHEDFTHSRFAFVTCPAKDISWQRYTLRPTFWSTWPHTKFILVLQAKPNELYCAQKWSLIHHAMLYAQSRLDTDIYKGVRVHVHVPFKQDSPWVDFLKEIGAIHDFSIPCRKVRDKEPNGPLRPDTEEVAGKKVHSTMEESIVQLRPVLSTQDPSMKIQQMPLQTVSAGIPIQVVVSCARRYADYSDYDFAPWTRSVQSMLEAEHVIDMNSVDDVGEYKFLYRAWTMKKDLVTVQAGNKVALRVTPFNDLIRQMRYRSLTDRFSMKSK